MANGSSSLATFRKWLQIILVPLAMFGAGWGVSMDRFRTESRMEHQWSRTEAKEAADSLETLQGVVSKIADQLLILVDREERATR